MSRWPSGTRRASGELATNIAVSGGRALAGLAIGGSIGFLLGLANGVSKLSEQLTDTTLQMIRTIPNLALIPLVILWFGIGEEAKLFLSTLGVMFPIYLNTFHGVRSVDPALVEMGRAYGMNGFDAVPPRDLSGCAAVDLRGPALLAGHHVDHADRRRNRSRPRRASATWPTRRASS